MLSRKVDVDGVGKVRNLCSYHVSWPVTHESLLAVLTSIVAAVLNNFATTVVTHTRRVKDSFIVFYPRNVAIQEIKVVLVCVILMLESVVDLANHIQVAVAFRLVTLVFAGLCKHCLVLTFSSVLLLGQVFKVLDVILTTFSQLCVPS